MLWLHPVFQGLTTLLGLYVLALGAKRFLAVHLGRDARFDRKRHVRLGRMVLSQWVLGLAGGLTATRLAVWLTATRLAVSEVLVTGWHWKIALVMLPLIVVGAWSGSVLNKVKRKRRALALLHAVNNLLLLCLALVQAWTGALLFEVWRSL